MKNTEDLISNLKDYYKKSLSVPNEFGGPSIYFHIQCIKEQKNNFLSERHIELIYATLTSWGMHRMGGPGMAEFEAFKTSIVKNKNIYQGYRELRLEKIGTKEYEDIIEDLRIPYGEMEVSTGNSIIVANSKTLTHILPNLFPPIDRRYTIRFFTQDNKNFFTKKEKLRSVNVPHSKDEQFNLFKTICKDIKELLDRCDLTMFQLDESSFNTSYPKIIDNLIMAFVKEEIRMNEVKNIIFKLAFDIFDLKYDEYLKQINRTFYIIRLIEDTNSNITDYRPFFGPNNPELISSIKNHYNDRGKYTEKAEFLVNAGPILNIPKLNADLFFISCSLLKIEKEKKEGQRIFYGQLFHELCHLIIDGKLKHPFESDEMAVEQGKLIREYTQYASTGPSKGDIYHHTDEWFALIFAASSKLAIKYANLFNSHREAGEYALYYDRVPEPMNRVQWKSTI